MPLSETLRRVHFHLRHPTAPLGHPDTHNPDLARRIREAFRGMIRPFDLKAAEFDRFKRDCGYPASYVDYMGPGRLNEKMLEHYVSLEITRPRPGEVLVDVGSAVSPFADHARERLGVTAWALDAEYPPGIHGNRIGCGAESVPLPDASVDVMTLHCTLDHFEGGRDGGFIREAARLLRPGGRVCVLPVYFSPRSANLCDPACFSGDIEFDAGAEIRRVPGHANRFGRYYSIESLRTRILEVSRDLNPTLWIMAGEVLEIPDHYLRYALELRKTT